MRQSFSARRANLAPLGTLALTFALGLTIAGCAPATTNRLADESQTEASNPDQALPQDSHFNDAAPAAVESAISTSQALTTLDKYDHLDPQHLVPRNLLASALTYFDQNQASIKNRKYLSVIDFSMPSSKRRFYIINMETGDVFATTTAHGKGSDQNNDGLADRFSNVEGTQASSLGIYLTAETYSGAHGLSLRLDGKSSTNSNVRSRAIVVHGADYVQDKDVRQGRSWGCPAIPMGYRDRIVGWIKGGSVIYAGLSAK